MGQVTEISWCDHTFNPVWGCTKVSAGCAHCYAETLAKRYGKDVWGPGERRTFADKHWNEPLKWARDAEKAGERRRVFCGSMCDVFEEHPTTEAQLPRLMALIAATSHALDWLLLTKRPERASAWLREWLATTPRWRVGQAGLGAAQPFWWLGTSVEDQSTLVARAPRLFGAPAAVRFLSYEPALGPIDLGAAPAYVDWVIVGGESGPGARPFDIAWARSVAEQCRTAGVACFVKQLGARPEGISDGISYRGSETKKPDGFYRYLNDRKGGDWSEWPEDLRVREFPGTAA